jgi:hypothetical protein
MRLSVQFFDFTHDITPSTLVSDEAEAKRDANEGEQSEISRNAS